MVMHYYKGSKGAKGARKVKMNCLATRLFLLIPVPASLPLLWFCAGIAIIIAFSYGLIIV